MNLNNLYPVGYLAGCPADLVSWGIEVEGIEGTDIVVASTCKGSNSDFAYAVGGSNKVYCIRCTHFRRPVFR